MAMRYQHRIGVRSELFFDVVLDDPNPSAHKLTLAVAQALRRVADDEGGVKSLSDLPESAVYPDWNAVDADIEPEHALDPVAVRIIDCIGI